MLFLQGGASLQFEMAPMNQLRSKPVADYVNTGEWSKKAIKAARGFTAVNVAASAEDKDFTYVPPQEQWQLSSDAAYVHYTANETIGGVEFSWVPDTGDVPLVCECRPPSCPVASMCPGSVCSTPAHRRTSVPPA